MSRRAARLAVVVVVGSMVLAACSSGGSTTSAASSPASPSGVGGVATSPPATATTGPGANPGSDYCTGLASEKTAMSKLSQTIGTAVASQDFATTKTTLATFFSTTAQALAQVETSMTGAPANVQAALGVVNQFFTHLQSAIASSTSLKQLGLAFEDQANSAQLRAATKVLDDYTKAQCGASASP